MSMFKSILREWRIIENQDNYDDAVNQIPRPADWRSSDTDQDPNPGDYEDWFKEHMAKTPKGSLVVGSLKIDPNDQQNPHAQYYWEYQLPSVIRHAQKAVASGKKLVYISNGDLSKDTSDVGQIADELNNRFPGKVHHDTASDPLVDVSDRVSPIWPRMYNAAKWKKDVAHAGISASLIGQGEDPSSLIQNGILTPEAREFVAQKYQLDLANPEHAHDIQALAYPKKRGMDHNEISHIAEQHSAVLQKSLLKKIKEAEDAGHVAISAPSASSAYSLKDTLEKGQHHLV